MAKLTKAQREWRPGMPKKRRSTKVLFASTVLLLEAFVAFFATLAVFGLKRGEVPPALILTFGISLSVVLILSGFVEPTMFVVGVLFAACWWYGIRAGMRIDRENVQRDREQAEWNASHGEDSAGQSA